MEYKLSEKELSKRKEVNKFLLIGFGVFVLAMIFGIAAKGKPKQAYSDQRPTFSVKYSSDSFTASSAVINPATLDIWEIVTNTGSVPGTPSCFVEAGDPSNTYKGYGTFESDEKIQPGKTWALHARLTITKEGASYITSSSTDCKTR